MKKTEIDEKENCRNEKKIHPWSTDLAQTWERGRLVRMYFSWERGRLVRMYFFWERGRLVRMYFSWERGRLVRMYFSWERGRLVRNTAMYRFKLSASRYESGSAEKSSI